ncbi:MAG: microcystin degradation protein MlrC [Yoonia sp.]|jgi:microcystin degradation protein MlrC
MKRIALGGLHTECSSYSPLVQTAADFTRTIGQDLIDLVPFDFAFHGIEVIPLFHDRSVPGGPVSAATFAAQRAGFMIMLQASLPLDGVLLLMHGAMFVPGIDDPEGDFIQQVREIVGPDAIISAAFDLHGQITDQICNAIDAFAAYRTAPHIDTPQTYARAAKMLSEALNSGVRPQVSWVPIPILVSGEMSSTFVAPCDALYAQLPAFDQISSVLDSNLMIGYIWADSPRATAAAVVTATDHSVGQTAAEAIAQLYRNARKDLTFDMDAVDLPVALDLVAGQTAILADSGDNPTAGGVGDRADVLAEVIKRQLDRSLIAGIADPIAYASLAGGRTEITLGNGLGGGGPIVCLIAETCEIFGDTAVVKSCGVTIIVTRLRRPFHNLTDFQALELSLNAFELLVVKSGYLSPDLRTLPRRQVVALTDGAVCQKLNRLANAHRPAGTWPFSLAT